MKKIISLLLILLSLLWTVSSYSVHAAEDRTTSDKSLHIIIGDTDRDGTVTLIDASFIEYYLVRSRGITASDKADEPLTDVQLRISDVDEDGLLTVADATAIQRYCLDIETFSVIGKSFPDPEPATEVVTEPETEPATEPATELVTEPATEPTTVPVTEPTTEPATTEPETEPATEVVTEPATVPETVPETQPATVPVTEPTTEPATEPTTVPVTEPLYPSSISFNKGEIVLTEGQTYKLNSTVEPVGVTDNTVKWYSDNPDVAEVDSDTGVIEARTKGCSSVIAQTSNGLTAECTVWVTSTEDEDVDEFGAGNTYNYTTNYYDIDYNITVNPTITADTNNFLASTGDTTDRSADIAAMLKQTGCCVLGSGEFFVKGVKMPDNTMIRGQGNATQVYWIDDNSPNYIFKLGSRCSLSDMWIRQYRRSNSDPKIKVQSEVRDFSAVEFSDTFSPGDTVSNPLTSTLSNLLITDIEGSGLKLSRTGTAPLAHLSAVNCFMLRCDCGILDDIISEFHQITNTTCCHCYYGVICRGGNNTFNNCNFSSNNVGIYLDNSNGESYNNGHGMFNACVIDHSRPNNTGTALLCDGISTGMRFVSCTFGYGTITVKNSDGIRFLDCGMGFMDVSVENSRGTVFMNLGLRKKSDFSVTETDSVNTRFINCFYKNGTEFVR